VLTLLKLALALAFPLAAAQPGNPPPPPPGAAVMDDAGEGAAQAELPPGWEWELAPTKLHEWWRQGGLSRFVDSGLLLATPGEEGQVIVYHVRKDESESHGAEAPEYRVYLLDADGQQIRSGGSMSMSGRSRLGVSRFQFRSEQDQEPASIGLAVLTFEGKKQLSEAALARAAEAGASALPLPVVGRPFAFDLPTIDGGRVRSEDLRGKVVLIDAWATWCGPCMAKMPELKKIREQYKDQGMVVIGLSFDRTKEAAEKTIDGQGLAWAHIYASDAAKGDSALWREATGISSIPRLFLIDREGILRGDLRPHELKEAIEAQFTDTR
jgi:thiol-disulfide isomerase/thioredoxin